MNHLQIADVLWLLFDGPTEIWEALRFDRSWDTFYDRGNVEWIWRIADQLCLVEEHHRDTYLRCLTWLNRTVEEGCTKEEDRLYHLAFYKLVRFWFPREVLLENLQNVFRDSDLECPTCHRLILSPHIHP